MLLAQLPFSAPPPPFFLLLNMQVMPAAAWPWGGKHEDKSEHGKGGRVWLLFISRSVMSDSLGPHEWQHASLPCPSLSPWICSNACPLSWWCHLLISSSAAAPSPLPSVFPSIRVFSNESAFCTRWPKYWSFSSSSSPFNEYSGLISFRSNWFDLLAVQGTLKSLL